VFVCMPVWESYNLLVMPEFPAEEYCKLTLATLLTLIRNFEISFG